MVLVIYIYGVNQVFLAIRSYVVAYLCYIQFCHIFFLENIQKELFMYRQPNATNVHHRMYQNIPFKDCRCHVASIESCLTDLQFKYTYILPLILLILETYIVRDLISFHYYRRAFLRKLYWIVAIFVLFCLLTAIYRSGDLYTLATLLLVHLGSCLLFPLCATTKVIP